MPHPALTPGRTAVITGGASGIGLATAERLAAEDLNVCIADVDADALAPAAEGLAQCAPRGGEAVLGVACDVARLEDVAELRSAALGRFGEVAFLMNNAGTGGGGKPWENLEGWRRVLQVNLWGVVHGLQVFTEGMVEQGTPCAIVNTGSKQGITNPPGDAAYNVSKAAIRSVTESLAHQLRAIEGCQVSAHLLVPGFTFTGMMRRHMKEKPAVRVAAGAGGRPPARRPGARRLLRPVPGQRGRPGDGPASHRLVGGRPDREPARPVALAPGLRGRVRRLRGRLEGLRQRGPKP